MNSRVIPNAVLMANNISNQCWSCMSEADRLEYMSVLNNANKKIRKHKIKKSKNGGLGATILDMGTATAYNQRSSEGRESAISWSVVADGDYSSPSDPQLARDLYCFQHYAEKKIDIAGEAKDAPETCNPNITLPQLYNRDGMLGERTQTLLVNYANSGGYNLTPDVELPDIGPIDDIANKLMYSLSWSDLDDALTNYIEIQTAIVDGGLDPDEAISSSGGGASEPPSASDMDVEWVDHYRNQGRSELIGTNPNTGTIRKDRELSDEEKKKAEDAKKRFDELFGKGKSRPSAFTDDNTMLYVGIAGVALIGGFVYLKKSKKKAKKIAN